MNTSGPEYEAVVAARQSAVVAISIFMTTLGALTVALRVFTRAKIVGRLFEEDWAIIATIFLTFIYLAEILIAVYVFDAGESGANLSPADMEGILKDALAIAITYKMTLTLTKVSILWFYLRLATRKSFEMMCKYTIYLLVLFQVILTFTTIFQCIPLQKQWDFTMPGRCINVNVFYHSASVFHILMDIWILVMPYQLVKNIKAPMKEKLALLFIFGLGILTILAAITRLTFLHIFTESMDPFFDIIPINEWSMVEINIGIMCASIPTLKPLISKSQRDRTKAAKSANSHSHSHKGSQRLDSIDMSITRQTTVDVRVDEEQGMSASHLPPTYSNNWGRGRV